MGMILHRSAVTGQLQSEAQAAANPRESVTETYPANVDIVEFVAALDEWGLELVIAAIEECGEFTHKATLQNAIEERLKELEGE